MSKDLFEGIEDVIHGNSLDMGIINQAEKNLGVVFADDYIEYLSKYTLAMFNGHEFTGLGKSKRTNVVFVTLQQRELDDSISKDWYVIEETGVDGIIVWQNKEGTIYINKRKAYSSLFDYIHNINSNSL